LKTLEIIRHKSRKKIMKISISFVLAVAFALVGSAEACTRILWNDNSIAVVTGRNADWFWASRPSGATDPKLHVMPRGLSKSGAKFGNQTIVTKNPAKWISRYGSIVVSTQNTSVFDGMNEKGLAAHSLSLPVTDYGVRDVSRQGIQMALWVPYILDNAATVAEAIALLPRIQPVQVVVDGFAMKLSLSIEDRSGDSAVIEYLNGQAVIYHDPQNCIMANTELNESRDFLASNYNFNFETSTRSTPLPGNGRSLDRFVRATFFRHFLGMMKPRSLMEVYAALMSVMRNTSNPIGAPGDIPGQGAGRGDETDWRSLCDLTNLAYVFENPRSLTLLKTDLKRINFGVGSGVRTFDPVNSNQQGDITRLYRPAFRPVPGVVR
jgi:choloylglycine hydrolase